MYLRLYPAPISNHHERREAQQKGREGTEEICKTTYYFGSATLDYCGVEQPARLEESCTMLACILGNVHIASP